MANKALYKELLLKMKYQSVPESKAISPSKSRDPPSVRVQSPPENLFNADFSAINQASNFDFDALVSLTQSIHERPKSIPPAEPHYDLTNDLFGSLETPTIQALTQPTFMTLGLRNSVTTEDFLSTLKQMSEWYIDVHLPSQNDKPVRKLVNSLKKVLTERPKPNES